MNSNESDSAKIMSITSEIKMMNQSISSLTDKVSEISNRNSRADDSISEIREYIAGQKGYYKAQEKLLGDLSDAQKLHHERVETTIKEALSRCEKTISEHTVWIDTLRHNSSVLSGKHSGIAIVFSVLLSVMSIFFATWEWFKSLMKGH
jgi:chromosome segregation ATPase